MSILDTLIGVIAPHHCVSCGAQGSLLCIKCAEKLPVLPSRCYRCLAASEDFRTCKRCAQASSIAEVWPVTAYDGAAKALVHRLKFDRAQDGARSMARCMAVRLPQDGMWVVTHVPTAPSRMRQRGYDQAQLIARSLARQIGAPYVPLLGRQSTLRQVGQGRMVRQKQMHDAFYVRRSNLAAKQRILLVDDVITTGATCEAAAAVLAEAGATRISVAVFAAA